MTLPYQHVDSLRDIPFDDNCLCIADANLPADMLDKLPKVLLVDAGEKLKSLAALEVLAERVLEKHASKPLTLVAVGGGSIGDCVGFLASILWRGVTLWHVPTTMLAMIDSAHGGKNAVNLPNAKNQLGTFYPAERTFIVKEALQHMPLTLRRDGLSEMLKIFLMTDLIPFEELPSFEELAFMPFDKVGDELVSLVDIAIRAKLDIVEQDPEEKNGIRSYLNLGHTLGHAIERVAGLSHGAAVAWGVAAMLECSREFGLSEAEASAIYKQLYPMLIPLPDQISQPALLEAMRMDKKTVNGKLRSIVLEELGQCTVSEKLRPEDWLAAYIRVRTTFEQTNVSVSVKNPIGTSIEIEASKSELNRALLIAAQRTGKTRISGKSSADDVQYLFQALTELGIGISKTDSGYESIREGEFKFPDRARTLHCGEGGTSFRFLLALACSLPQETILLASPGLLARPQEQLLTALRAAGATIDEYHSSDGSGFRVRGWESMPKSFTVDASISSQYASALALLSAGSATPFTIRLEGQLVSESYLRMTLSMLEHAGVEVIFENNIIACNPSEKLETETHIEISADASSAAGWKVAAFLGHPVQVSNVKLENTLQPDTKIDRFLEELRKRDGETVLDLSDAPDLLPVLFVAAIYTGKPVSFIGIDRLKHKESNRIDGFADSLRDIGIPVERLQNGLVSPDSSNITLKQQTVFKTHGDHRIVMAGALLSLFLGPVLLDFPWSVSKSYPGFWSDARAAGWSLQPAFD
jgi:3-phosphoshikimate 1-carboxyvinyltransferase